MKLVMALDNLVNDKYTGVFNVTLTAHVKYEKTVTAHLVVENIADKIIPISASDSSYGYFTIQPGPMASATRILKDLPRNIEVISRVGCFKTHPIHH